jgi:hypothetical protein
MSTDSLNSQNNPIQYTVEYREYITNHFHSIALCVQLDFCLSRKVSEIILVYSSSLSHHNETKERGRASAVLGFHFEAILP